MGVCLTPANGIPFEIPEKDKNDAINMLDYPKICNDISPL